jgi:hypothetical protein
VLDSLEYDSADTFAKTYDFTGIEPFTLVMVDTEGGTTLHDFRWDGICPHLKKCDPHKASIWSSPSLYDPIARTKKEAVFFKWLEKQSDMLSENILELHLTGSYGDPANDFKMNRGNIVQTVSVTQVTDASGSSTMKYVDLLTGKEQLLNLY